jgi:CheY-like chemotaxis protein/two-component sensor histidine kinase
LKQADRLKDQVLAMLAHELRNPLAPIRNCLLVIRQAGGDPDLLEQVLEMAERQVQHMTRLLDDLLDVSRINQGRIVLRPEEVDLAPLTRRAVDALKPLYEERRLRLTVELPSQPIRITGDPTRLEQVVNNLLNNAAKYTEPGGHVELTVQHEGAEVVLRIHDNGIGIPPEMLSRIFDLFVQVERRVRRSQGGVGIGLTLVRKLVELHGGTVEAFSPGPGHGSEFVVRLPARSPKSGDRRTPAKEPDFLNNSESRHRVLVVDDNVDAAVSLGMLLRLAGQEVRVAYDGATALRQAQEFQPHLVLLDIGMPGMDGYEVCRHMRQELGMDQTTVVALTGWGQDEDRRRSQEAGFNHHIVKPVEPSALRRLLDDLATDPSASSPRSEGPPQ